MDPSKKLIVYLFVMFGLVGASAGLSSAQTNRCSVSGTVSDLGDAVGTGITVQFKNASFESLAETDLNGRYSTKLNKDLYEVLLKGPFEYFNYRRAKVEVSCETNLAINLYLLPECVSYSCGRRGYSFEILKSVSNSDSTPNLVIAYNEKNRKGNDIIYSDAMLTYNSYSLFAKEITQDRITRRTTARNGWVEQGQIRKPFKEINVDFAPELLNPKAKLRSMPDRENVRALRKIWLPNPKKQ